MLASWANTCIICYQKLHGKLSLWLRQQFPVLIFLGNAASLRNSSCSAFPFPRAGVPAPPCPWLQVSAPYLWWLHHFLPVSSTRTLKQTETLFDVHRGWTKAGATVARQWRKNMDSEVFVSETIIPVNRGNLFFLKSVDVTEMLEAGILICWSSRLCDH